MVSEAESGVERSYNHTEEASYLDCWYWMGVLWEEQGGGGGVGRNLSVGRKGGIQRSEPKVSVRSQGVEVATDVQLGRKIKVGFFCHVV